MTAAGFRRIALALDGAEERAHMGHPDFRVGGRIFATLHADGRYGMVKLRLEEQQAFVEQYPAAFMPENGAWGRQGCTRVTLKHVDEETLGQALTLAWRDAGTPRTAERARGAVKAGRTGRTEKEEAGGMYVALLRAVNLAGKHSVSMPALCEMFGAAGLSEARSVLQSGNVVFRAGTQTSSIEARLETAAARRLGLQTDFLVRSAREWAAIVAGNPFRAEAERDPARLLVLVAKSPVKEADVRRLQELIPGRERVAPGGRHVYAVYPEGVGRSRLTTALVEKAVSTRVTGRNWNTVLKIAALLGV
jgi:uncharacterized protein (DUF1697 family)